MARASKMLIDALLQTAARLRTGATYQWTHMGACNCGHLAQTVTKVSRADLHAMALERAGDWSEQVVEYCPTSNLPIDHVIATMLAMGLTVEDLAHLERLSDQTVLALLPRGERHLDYRKRDDVVRYLETWAEMLRSFLTPELHESEQAMHRRAGPDQGGECMPDHAAVTTGPPELRRTGRDDVDDVTRLRDREPGADRELTDGQGVGTAKTNKAA